MPKKLPTNSMKNKKPLYAIPMTLLSIIEFIVMMTSFFMYYDYSKYVIPTSLFLYGVLSTIVIVRHNNHT